MSQLEEKSKFDRSGKARTNERKYPYIVELSVPLTGLDIQLSRQITTLVSPAARRIATDLRLRQATSQRWSCAFVREGFR
jgi:hypothetical protein